MAFRDLAGEHLPPHIARRDKFHQSLPLAEWFRGPLREFVASELGSEGERGQDLLDPEGIAVLLGEHWTGAADRGWDILKILTLTAWHRSVFKPLAAVDGGVGSR